MCGEVGAIQAGDRSYDLLRRVPATADDHVVLVQRLGQGFLHGLCYRRRFEAELLARDNDAPGSP